MIAKNNLLNIRSSSAFNWVGQIGSQKGFCEFESIEMCRRAGSHLLLRSYRRAACTSIHSIISRWAPSNENPTAEYIRFVAKMTSIPITEPLFYYAQYASVLSAMEIFEQGIVGVQRNSYFMNAKQDYLVIFDQFKIIII